MWIKGVVSCALRQNAIANVGAISGHRNKSAECLLYPRQRNLRVIVDGQSENVGSFEVSSCAMGQKSRVTILHDWLVMAQLTPTRREKTNG
jgi:hypothetical protein